MPIEITVRDTDTGDTETTTIWNDVLVITAGDTYVAHVNAHAANGTQVYTVKNVGGAR